VTLSAAPLQSSSSSSSIPLCFSILSHPWRLPFLLAFCFLAASAWPGELALDVAACRRVLALIEQLGAEDHRTREAAQAALADAPPVALPLLREYENSDDPEIRLRIREIIPRVRESPQRLEKELQERLKRDGVEFHILSVDDRKLVSLNVAGTDIADLAPLKGIPLAAVDFRNTKVTDLSPLADMPLENLTAPFTITDGFDAIRKIPTLKLVSGTPVEKFCRECLARKRFSDAGVAWRTFELCDDGQCVLSFGQEAAGKLAGLRGLPLETLILTHTRVADLRPLRGMPLRSLHIAGTQVTDLTPLQGMQLSELFFNSEQIEAGIEVIRNMRSVRCPGGEAISGHFIAAAEFWERYAARKKPPR